jgi:enoyl-CoA hydratase/carnithine racemase
MVMTGRFFTSEEADQAGLLTRLVEDGAHRSVAEELARAILDNPQSAVREIVRIRRSILADRLREIEQMAGAFDWAGSAESSERIAAKLAQINRSHKIRTHRVHQLLAALY